MDSATPSFASTKETTNYARLCRLLVDVGTEVLRKVFDEVRPQGALSQVLTSPSVMSVLQSLKGKKVLKSSQWDKLFPSNKHKVSSAEFDITLLMVLVRNICDLAPPSTGWDSLPPATDKSKQADIARIKYYRNTVYGHAKKASLHDTEYSMYWQEIKDTLVRLGGQQCENTINDLETECIDPEMEGCFQDLLRQWVKDEKNIKDKVDEITEKFERKFEDLKKAFTSEFGEITNKVHQVECGMKTVTEKLNGLMILAEENKDEENKTEQIEQMIQNVIEKLDVMMAENTTDKLQQMENKLKAANKKIHGLMISTEENKDEETMTDKLQQHWNQQMESLWESQLKNVLEKMDTLIALKDDVKDEENNTEKFEQLENQIQNVNEKLDLMVAENTKDKQRKQQMESHLEIVSKKLDALIASKEEIKDKVEEKLQQIENHMKKFFDAIFLTDQSRAPLVLDSSHKGDESISSIQDYGSGNPSIESSLYTSMNAQVDSLGSISASSVFSGARIGAIANCPIQVKNEFRGNVNFVNNIYRQNDKQDTDKD